MEEKNIAKVQSCGLQRVPEGCLQCKNQEWAYGKESCPSHQVTNWSLKSLSKVQANSCK